LLSPDQVHGENIDLAGIGLLPVQPQKLILLVHGGPKVSHFYYFEYLLIISLVKILCLYKN
jgi:hypothetical protein